MKQLVQATTVRGRQFSYSHTIGNAAIFCYPVHMSLDADNNLYVVNRGHDGDWVFGINKITVDEDEIGKFGGEGETDGRFVWPTAIVIDRRGLAYVADEWLNRISIFDTTVEFQRRGYRGEELPAKVGRRRLQIRDSLAHRRASLSTPTRTCTSRSRATIGCPNLPATANFC